MSVQLRRAHNGGGKACTHARYVTAPHRKAISHGSTRKASPCASFTHTYAGSLYTLTLRPLVLHCYRLTSSAGIQALCTPCECRRMLLSWTRLHASHLCTRNQYLPWSSFLAQATPGFLLAAPPTREDHVFDSLSRPIISPSLLEPVAPAPKEIHEAPNTGFHAVRTRRSNRTQWTRPTACNGTVLYLIVSKLRTMS